MLKLSGEMAGKITLQVFQGVGVSGQGLDRLTKGGGLLLNQCPHQLDLLQWLAGFPVDVQAQTSCFRLRDAVQVEDTAHGYFHFAENATGIFYATLCYGADAPIELDLVLENAEIELKKDLTIRYKDGRVEHMDDTTKAGGKKGYWGDGHSALIRDYYEKLLAGEPFPIDGKEASKTIRIIESIYRSAATGQKVLL